MTRFFHASDLHFGAEDTAALDWFAAAVRMGAPEGVVITGDITMRAKPDEFEAAARWLESLACPVTIEVGNHDLPYANMVERMFRPYRRYRAVKDMVERPLALGSAEIVPLKTTARFQWRLNWSKGRVGRRSLAEAVRRCEASPDGRKLFVACHHPLAEPGTRSSSRTRGGEAALEALAGAGANAVLTGHVHDPFDIAHRTEAGILRLIGAGTLSQRTRDAAPSFNAITVGKDGIEVSHRFLE